MNQLRELLKQASKQITLPCAGCGYLLPDRKCKRPARTAYLSEAGRPCFITRTSRDR